MMDGKGPSRRRRAMKKKLEVHRLCMFKLFIVKVAIKILNWILVLLYLEYYLK